MRKTLLTITVVLLLGFVAFGLYNGWKTNSLPGWLTAPFTSSEAKTDAGDGTYAAKSGEDKAGTDAENSESTVNTISGSSSSSEASSSVQKSEADDGSKESGSETGDHTPKTGENK